LAEVLQYRQSGNFVATPSISWKANPKADGSLASLPLTVFGLFLIFQSVFTRNPAIDVSCNDFANEIRAGHIAQVQVGDIKYEGKFKSGVKKPNEPQTISTGRLPGIDDGRSLMKCKNKMCTSTIVCNRKAGGRSFLPWLLPILLIAAIYAADHARER
jgi:hypothetical protein